MGGFAARLTYVCELDQRDGIIITKRHITFAVRDGIQIYYTDNDVVVPDIPPGLARHQNLLDLLFVQYNGGAIQTEPAEIATEDEWVAQFAPTARSDQVRAGMQMQFLTAVGARARGVLEFFQYTGPWDAGVGWIVAGRWLGTFW
jgi:hypothetical protein